MDNILGNVSVCGEGVDTVDTNLPGNKRLVSSNVRPVSEKQCVSERKCSHCDNGSSNDEISTEVTELWELVQSSKLNIYDLLLVIEECCKKPQHFMKGQNPLGKDYVDKLVHVHVMKASSAQYYHCLNLHACPHYQVSPEEYLQLVMDALHMDISVSYYSSSKTNGHERNNFLRVMNEGTTKNFSEWEKMFWMTYVLRFNCF